MRHTDGGRFWQRHPLAAPAVFSWRSIARRAMLRLVGSVRGGVAATPAHNGGGVAARTPGVPGHLMHSGVLAGRAGLARPAAATVVSLPASTPPHQAATRGTAPPAAQPVAAQRGRS